MMSHEEKLRKYGEGEWIDEPDEVFFSHTNIACEIFRHSRGYLIGMCQLPDNHPWSSMPLKKAEICIHGHQFIYKTFQNEYVGFSCDMLDDMIPVFNTDKLAEQVIDAFNKKNDQSYERFIYRNLSFVTEQCKYLAEQIIEAHEPTTKSNLKL